MNALAQPGTRQPMKAVDAPAPLPGLLATIGCALLDHRTSLFLDEPLRDGGQVAEWLAFQTGATIEDREDEDVFAFLADGRILQLSDFHAGDQAYPDRSATLCVAVPSLTGGPSLLLQGPGIEREARIAPAGLPDDFAAQWAENHALFPRGVDLFLTAEGEGVIGLPRSISIVAEGQDLS